MRPPDGARDAAEIPSFGLRALERRDIPIVADLPPADWHFAFDRFLELHLGWPYFHGLVAEASADIVGVGNAILNGSTAWLGNIVVSAAARGRGIGSRLTAQLVEEARARQAATFVLIATALGERVYRRLGFETTGLYRFYRGGPVPAADAGAGLRRMEPGDHPCVLALDQVASAESRRPLLSRFLETGWVHTRDGRVDGYYLPDLGAGLVVAADDRAGISLLHLKLQHAPDQVVIPDENECAKQWLLAHGYSEALTAPRMCLGADVAWQPRFVFSRGAGYCG